MLGVREIVYEPSTQNYISIVHSVEVQQPPRDFTPIHRFLPCSLGIPRVCSPLSNHLKGSKLKADAPEFVPLQQSTPFNSPNKTVSKEVAKLQKKLEKAEQKAEQKASFKKTPDKKTVKFQQASGVCRRTAERIATIANIDHRRKDWRRTDFNWAVN